MSSGTDDDETGSLVSHRDEHLLSASERIRLRFPELLDTRPPLGFLHVDDALDQVGADRFPEEWGRSPVWLEHPFRFEEKRQRYVSYNLYRTKELFWKIRMDALRKRSSEKDLRRSDEIYKRVVSELSAALESGRVQGYEVRRGHTCKTLSALTFTQNSVFIFYIGYVFRGYAHKEAAAKSRSRVLIDYRSFESWLYPPATATVLSARLSSEIIEKLTAHAEASGLKLRKGDLLEIWQEVAGEQLSDRQFDRLWRDPRLAAFKMPRGHPKQADLDAMKREKEAVRQILIEAFRRRAQSA